jgi:hypothetical protein
VSETPFLAAMKKWHRSSFAEIGKAQDLSKLRRKRIAVIAPGRAGSLKEWQNRRISKQSIPKSALWRYSISLKHWVRAMLKLGSSIREPVT